MGLAPHERSPSELPAPSAMQRHREKVAAMNQEGGPHQNSRDTESDGTLTLDFQPSELRAINVVCKLPSLWHFSYGHRNGLRYSPCYSREFQSYNS